MDFERCLPRDAKLDCYIEQGMEDFEHTVSKTREKHAGNDILDSSVEFDTFETITYFDTIANNMLVTFVDERNKSEFSDETRDAIYRAMVFAYQTGLEVHGSNTGFNASNYLAGLMQNFDDPKYQFECDVQDYLADNPHVDAYIDLYAYEIDEGRNQLPAIELAAGMIFMLIERRLGEMFINSQAEALTPQDFGAQS